MLWFATSFKGFLTCACKQVTFYMLKKLIYGVLFIGLCFIVSPVSSFASGLTIDSYPDGVLNRVNINPYQFWGVTDSYLNQYICYRTSQYKSIPTGNVDYFNVAYHDNMGNLTYTILCVADSSDNANIVSTWDVQFPYDNLPLNIPCYLVNLSTYGNNTSSNGVVNGSEYKNGSRWVNLGLSGPTFPIEFQPVYLRLNGTQTIYIPTISINDLVNELNNTGDVDETVYIKHCSFNKIKVTDINNWWLSLWADCSDNVTSVQMTLSADGFTDYTVNLIHNILEYPFANQFRYLGNPHVVNGFNDCTITCTLTPFNGNVRGVSKIITFDYGKVKDNRYGSLTGDINIGNDTYNIDISRYNYDTVINNNITDTTYIYSQSFYVNNETEVNTVYEYISNNIYNVTTNNYYETFNNVQNITNSYVTENNISDLTNKDSLWDKIVSIYNFMKDSFDNEESINEYNTLDTFTPVFIFLSVAIGLLFIAFIIGLGIKIIGIFI